MIKDLPPLCKGKTRQGYRLAPGFLKTVVTLEELGPFERDGVGINECASPLLVKNFLLIRSVFPWMCSEVVTQSLE